MLKLKQMYFTVPMAIAYWCIPMFTAVPTDNSGLTGYMIFGLMLTIGATYDVVDMVQYRDYK